MRSYILPLAALAASVMAAPKPYDDCTTKGNTVVEYYDVTVTEVVYVTAAVSPTYAPASTTCTTKRRKHKHTSKKPVYAAPTGYVVTITEGGYEAAPTPAPVYNPPPAPKPVAPKPNYGSKPEITGDYKTDVVNYHNYYRAHHGAAPLTWSDDLANYAAGNTGSCQMEHTGGPYGENLAMGTSLDGHEGTQMWYDEGQSYYGQGFSMDTGHYTQLIWKGSQQIGCYLQNCGDQNYLMCEYYPPGNVEGQYEDNCGGLDGGIDSSQEYGSNN